MYQALSCSFYMFCLLNLFKYLIFFTFPTFILYTNICPTLSDTLYFYKCYMLMFFLHFSAPYKRGTGLLGCTSSGMVVIMHRINSLFINSFVFIYTCILSVCFVWFSVRNVCRVENRLTIWCGLSKFCIFDNIPIAMGLHVLQTVASNAYKSLGVVCYCIYFCF